MDLQSSFGMLRDVQGVKGPFMNPQGLSGTRRDLQGPSEMLGDLLGLSGTFKDFQRPSGTLRTFGFFRDLQGDDGPSGR